MIAKNRGFINMYVVVTSYLALRRNMSQELAGCFWAPIKEGNLIEQEITACL